MASFFHRLVTFLQNMGIIPVVVQSQPLSEADLLMKAQLLSAVSRLIRTGTEDLHLQIKSSKVPALVRGQALYLPGQDGGDGNRTYFVITPFILGEYYWSDKFFFLTGLARVVSLSYLYGLKDAVEAWVESFYEAEDTADFLARH
ncbi:MAG: hypothetical protein ACD_61C00056G0009 [uncultured bacterium]|nr:MAG: hypothetical protein ACD_61C00056G0009 [uncultured bacterium]